MPASDTGTAGQGGNSKDEQDLPRIIYPVELEPRRVSPVSGIFPLYASEKFPFSLI